MIARQTAARRPSQRDMTDTSPPNRCRLILIAPVGRERRYVRAAPVGSGRRRRCRLADHPRAPDEASFQAFAAPIVRIAQEAGLAAIIAEDTRIAGRVGADGIHLQTKPDGIREAVERSRGKMIVGAGGAATRDDALDAWRSATGLHLLWTLWLRQQAGASQTQPRARGLVGGSRRSSLRGDGRLGRRFG